MKKYLLVFTIVLLLLTSNSCSLRKATEWQTYDLNSQIGFDYPGDWNCKEDKASVKCDNGSLISSASVFFNVTVISSTYKVDKDSFASLLSPRMNQAGQIDEIEVGGSPALRWCSSFPTAEMGMCYVLAGKAETFLIFYSAMPWKENQTFFDHMLSRVHFVSSLSNNQPDKTMTSVTGFDPSILFPMTVGTEWTYHVEIGEVDPLYYREIRWGEETYGVRGIFPKPSIQNKDSQTFILKMKVASSADDPNIILVTIEEDDLGIFEDAKMISWIKKRYSSEGILADQVIIEAVTYPKDIGPSNADDDGFSVRILFFLANNGTQLAIPQDNAIDHVTLIGIDMDLPRYTDIPLIHFRRVVTPNLERNDELSKGFTEDTWFAERKGLVRLEQKIEGKTSMVWTLIQFSDGMP